MRDHEMNTNPDPQNIFSEVLQNFVLYVSVSEI